jgi:hypothetical protein
MVVIECFLKDEKKSKIYINIDLIGGLVENEDFYNLFDKNLDFIGSTNKSTINNLWNLGHLSFFKYDKPRINEY